jgi:predicted kinase
MNKAKIICYVGISNSGKSTYAHQEWLKDPLNTVVISRDKVRNLLWNYTDENVHEYYNHPDFNKLEKEITKYCNTLIYEAIESNKTIILDNTHLDFKRDIKSLEYWNVPIQLVCFDITLKEALTRNMCRNRKVDEQIIIKQYNKYVGLGENAVSYSFSPKIINNDMTKQSCFVFDIDGCLADNKGERSPFDWDKVGNDAPIKSVIDTFNYFNGVNEWQQFLPLYICSGRDEVCREETEKWLNKHLYDAIKEKDVILLLRPKNDMRPDWVIKQEMVEKIVETNHINAWFDDRTQVTVHLRALGIKVFSVEHNNF